MQMRLRPGESWRRCGVSYQCEPRRKTCSHWPSASSPCGCSAGLPLLSCHTARLWRCLYSTRSTLQRRSAPSAGLGAPRALFASPLAKRRRVRHKASALASAQGSRAHRSLALSPPEHPRCEAYSRRRPPPRCAGDQRGTLLHGAQVSGVKPGARASGGVLDRRRHVATSLYPSRQAARCISMEEKWANCAQTHARYAAGEQQVRLAAAERDLRSRAPHKIRLDGQEWSPARTIRQ